MLGYNIQILPDAVLGENPYLVQVRTHKKKRINKKWAKRYGYVTKYKTFNTMVFDNTVFMTEQMYQDLQRGIGNEINQCR